MSYVLPKSIDIARLNRTPSAATVYKEAEEFRFYDAYVDNLATAVSLGNSGLYQDAWLSLNVAVECFFKDIFCLLRHKIENLVPTGTSHNLVTVFPPAKSFMYGGDYYASRKIIFAREFGHEVSQIWVVIDYLTNASAVSTEFSNFNTLHIPTKDIWVNTRYSKRNHAAYKSKFTDYHKDFEAILNGAFRGLK